MNKAVGLSEDILLSPHVVAFCDMLIEKTEYYSLERIRKRDFNVFKDGILLLIRIGARMRAVQKYVDLQVICSAFKNLTVHDIWKQCCLNRRFLDSDDLFRFFIKAVQYLSLKHVDWPRLTNLGINDLSISLVGIAFESLNCDHLVEDDLTKFSV